MARIRGDKRFDRKLRKEAEGVNVTPVLLKGAEELRTEYVRSVNRITGSRSQQRSNPYRNVTVSDPGTPPNTDTGDLVNSTGTDSPRKNQAVAFVSSDHAAPLEFGTAKMNPRPALQPAFDKTKKSISEDIRKFIKRENRKDG